MNIFQTTPRIVFGAGSLALIAQEVEGVHGKNVMIVCGPHLIHDGTTNTVVSLLEASGMKIGIFSRIDPDPTIETALAAAEATKAFGADAIVGMGGGSALDIAKTASILATNEQPLQAFLGVNLVPKPGLKTILIPTTAGTGSEVTAIAILSDKQEKLKKGIVSPYLIPAVAVMDPQLTVSCPPGVTAATGMDAFTHAIEAYTSRKAYPLTDLLAEQAMKLLVGNIRRAVQDGSDLAARSNMLEGSLLAGIAFANAGVAGVHALSYPVGAEFDIPHGVASCIMLPAVVQFNLPANPSKYAAVTELLDPGSEALDTGEAAQQAGARLSNLIRALRIPHRLRDYGVRAEHIPALAQGAIKVTRLLANNPREITLSDAEEIYRKAL